jgi:hypothetical protein
MPFHRGDIPWNEIRDRFIKGESATAIAKDYPVSRQAIQKRAKKEGWEKDGWLERAKETPTAKAVAKPKTNREKVIVSLGKRTPENAAEICRLIERGVPHTVAAEAVGMHRDTLRAWRNDDPDIDAMVHAARKRSIARKIERIDEAGERGDWKADAWHLERAPETRAEFGGSKTHDVGGITVILNVADPKQPEMPVIDATPVSAR